MSGVAYLTFSLLGLLCVLLCQCRKLIFKNTFLKALIITVADLQLDLLKFTLLKLNCIVKNTILYTKTLQLVFVWIFSFC